MLCPIGIEYNRPSWSDQSIRGAVYMMKEGVFREVQIEKVSDKIADQLTALIKDGKLVPGDRLPSERELIKILGVGRSSLREALNRLEILGYVQIVKRKGIFVKSISSAVQLDPLKQVVEESLEKIIQLYDVRGDLEQANAYQAAIHRTDDNIQELNDCLDSMGMKDANQPFTWKKDQAFHTAVARSSNNIFRIHVLINILDFSKDLIRPVIERFGNTKNNFNLIRQQHADIVEAIVHQKPEQAQENMKTHLDWTNQQFIDYFNKKGG